MRCVYGMRVRGALCVCRGVGVGVFFFLFVFVVVFCFVLFCFLITVFFIKHPTVQNLGPLSTVTFFLKGDKTPNLTKIGCISHSFISFFEMSRSLRTTQHFLCFW